MSKGKMNAEMFEVGHKAIVIAKPTGFNMAFANVMITIEGQFQSSIAKGILRMLNEDQCNVCGKFNGLHGEVFHVTGMDNGEVNGHYKMCVNAEGK